MSPRALRLARACGGLAAAPLAWLAHHQAGAYLNFADCRRGDGATDAAIGLAALAIALAGAALSWSAWRGKPPETQRFLAVLGMLSGGLFSLTIAVQIIAALILPACFR